MNGSTTTAGEAIRHLPNALSLFRVLASPALLALAFGGLRTEFLSLLVLCLATDLLDGKIARRYGLETERGARLDSLGDKLTFLAGVAGLLLFERGLFLSHPEICGAVLSLYLFQMAFGFWRYGRMASFHTWAAKAVAHLQGLFIVFTIAWGVVPWTVYLVGFATLVELAEEILLAALLPEWRCNVPGLHRVLRERRAGK